MPPAPPSPPLSYTTAPAVLPYTLPFHPYRPSSPPSFSSSSSSSLPSPPRHTHRLCVAAAVLSTVPSPAPPKILLLRRSAREKSLPHRWELPGGAADAPPDPDALAAAARELWEETRLRAARFAALVGCYQWAGAGPSAPADAADVRGGRGWALRDGGVGIVAAGAPGTGTGTGTEAAAAGDAWRKYTYLVEVEPPAADGAAAVVVDPEEHDAFVWATEEEVREGRCGRVVFEWTSEAQRLDVLRAFEISNEKR
ncbi:hypothetical protein LX36DRAFT_745300 [Colletotrichum falcatum]|nr:hypothetical protein LX36DRAFT_745300 [Colletotrichum falcatum]